MIPYSAKKSLLYSELDKDTQKRFFDYTKHKFLHNIDSLYYVIKVKNYWNDDNGVQLLLSYLERKKQIAMKSHDPVVLFQEDFGNISNDFVMNGIGSKPYTYDISRVDKYMVFIMGSQLNGNTPELWVQIRSQNLWLQGEYESVRESIDDLTTLLAHFNIEIEEIKENRIDYAYHTNYIQDMTNYFKPENLNKMQCSNFKRWSIEGDFEGQKKTNADYFTMGRKKSNNLFFRVYDKTKEVIEKGYKQFFIKLWYMEKMISYFDYYCIEMAFLNGTNSNYKYLDVARLKFYFDYGSDNEIKEKILDLTESNSYDYEAIRELADKIVPNVTVILNVEIETKRKFYYSLDNSVDMLLKLKSKDVPAYAKRLYLKLDNKQVFHDYLTSNNELQKGVLRFINHRAKNKHGKAWTKKEKFPTADWWKRLQKVKLNRKFKSDDVELVREYQKSLDIELMKKKTMNNLTTYKLYLQGDKIKDKPKVKDEVELQEEFYDDVLDFLSTLNENDIENALTKKRKKMTLLQERLQGLNDSTDIENHLKLYDSETGQIF